MPTTKSNHKKALRAFSTGQYANRRATVVAKSKLLRKLGYKKAGLIFVAVGIVIGIMASYVFWQDVVSAGSNKGWSFVGPSSLYQEPKADINNPRAERLIANIYACKQHISGGQGFNGNYKVKARATVLYNFLTKQVSDPQLEVISEAARSTYYVTSQPITAAVQPGTVIETPYTQASVKGSETLHYALSNAYAQQPGGLSLFAFGTVATLIDC